jgi:hypothetical protein
LHGWARRQQQKKEEEYNAKPGMNRKEKKTSTGSAAMLVDVLVGESPAGGTCPVTTVVISGDGASDQSVGSPEVKVSVGLGETSGQLRQERRASRQVVTKANCSKAPKSVSPA